MRQRLACAIGVVVLLTLTALSTRYVHPHWMFSALYTMHLHVTVACVLATIIGLLAKRDIMLWGLLVASVVLTADAVAMATHYSLPADPADLGKPKFRLLSINALNSNFESGETIARMIVASGADVVNVMEAPPLRHHIDELAQIYPYRVGCGAMTRQCDQLMLSKFPIESPQLMSLSKIFDERFITATIKIAGQTINFAGIHTTKPYFDDFHSLELKNAAGVILTQMTGPLVLSGDFNASSLDPGMQNFLKTTGLRTALWEPATWPVEAGRFGLPVDHIYARPPLKIISVTRLPDAYGSNHYGLTAEIAISKS